MNSDKNTAASVRQRLLNLARERNEDFQLILTRFALERFLYRLSQSKYQNDFVLKGAMLFQVWGGDVHRPTRDLDLLSFGKPDITFYEMVLKDICSYTATDDGLIFQTDTIKLDRIKEDDEYHGLRAHILVLLGTTRISLQIDIGFGDAVIPDPQSIEYPVLLDLPVPVLRAYSRETVVAEKLHAMVDLGIANSRMKDFYDLWVLAQTYDFDGTLLSEAIKATFDRRGTSLPTDTPLAFTSEFYEDNNKITQWNAFLRKGKLSERPISLQEVIVLLEKLLMPTLFILKKKPQDSEYWNSSTASWTKKMQ